MVETLEADVMAPLAAPVLELVASRAFGYVCFAVVAPAGGWLVGCLCARHCAVLCSAVLLAVAVAVVAFVTIVADGWCVHQGKQQ
jgi:hypothetical protein